MLNIMYTVHSLTSLMILCTRTVPYIVNNIMYNVQSLYIVNNIMYTVQFLTSYIISCLSTVPYVIHNIVSKYILCTLYSLLHHNNIM